MRALINKQTWKEVPVPVDATLVTTNEEIIIEIAGATEKFSANEFCYVETPPLYIGPEFSIFDIGGR